MWRLGGRSGDRIPVKALFLHRSRPVLDPSNFPYIEYRVIHWSKVVEAWRLSHNPPRAEVKEIVRLNLNSPSVLMTGYIATFTFTFYVGKKDFLFVTLLGTEQEFLMTNVSSPYQFSSNTFQEEFQRHRFHLYIKERAANCIPIKYSEFLLNIFGYGLYSFIFSLD